MAFRFPGKSAAISLTRFSADSGSAFPPSRCGTNPELPRLRGTGGPPVTPARPCTIRGLSFPAGYPTGGGLLPRLFTLTLLRRSQAGRYVFCDTFRQPRLASGLPPVSQGGSSCGVRTFLPFTHPKVAKGRLPELRLNNNRRNAVRQHPLKEVQKRGSARCRRLPLETTPSRPADSKQTV